jgi:phosphoenolpyruvate---glycerone phosphotransferase subunit DhaK
MSVRTTKLINDPAAVVAELLDGYTAAHPQIISLRDGLVVRTHPKGQGKVGLVIGNGSGHEPAMIGWVGHGLFDVNVPGPIFTAPGPSQLLAGIAAADFGAGVLVCVSNHTGDVLNAEMALEDLQAQGRSDVDSVILYDDIGSAPKENEGDRRGAAGLFFVWKIVGAYAEEGASLESCKSMAEQVRDNTRSLSATLGSCAHPLTGLPLADIPEGEMVIGVGVHGESRGDTRPVPTADELIDIMVPHILDDLDCGPGDEVCVLVNNAGSLTVMELSILCRRTLQILTERGIHVHRTWLGAYATTQDTAGFAIAVCRVDDEVKRLYDAPALGAGIHFAASAQTRSPL